MTMILPSMRGDLARIPWNQRSYRKEFERVGKTWYVAIPNRLTRFLKSSPPDPKPDLRSASRKLNICSITRNRTVPQSGKNLRWHPLSSLNPRDAIKPASATSFVSLGGDLRAGLSYYSPPLISPHINSRPAPLECPMCYFVP